MRKSLRAALLSVALAAILIAGQASVASAASSTLSFANGYAFEGQSFNGGSVTYQYGSGVYNYLRATAQADIIPFAYQVLSVRQGWINSASGRYTGPTGGSLTFRLNGTFTRELNGGFSLLNGVGFRHIIAWSVRDTNTGQIIGQWSIADEEILCGGLVWPIGISGLCNGTSTETYPSGYVRTISGSNIVSGHYYRLRVDVASVLSAGGVGASQQAKTTARDMSGSMSW